MTKAEIMSMALVGLRDKTGDVFNDDDMAAIIDQVVREISRKSGLAKKANLAFVQYTKDVDLGSLPFLDINNVEYPVGNGGYEPRYRQYDQYGTTLSINLSAVPAIVAGTLTGTVTWAPSRAVTGSGTKFTTELQVGNFIQVGKVADAAYKWYQVAHITSDTALTLMEPFEESTTADTVSLTKYRDNNGCAKVYYTGEYTIAAASNMPTRYDELAVLGVVAHAAAEFAAGNLADVVIDAVALVTSATTQTGLASARLAQVVTDLSSGRTNFNTSAISTDMGLADTALDKAVSDLAAGVQVINTVNIGGDVAGKYVETAKGDIAAAQTWIEKIKAYIDEPKPNLDIAAQEANTAAGYVNQALGYMQIVDRLVAIANSNGIAASYQKWADKKWAEYQTKLGHIGMVKIRNYGSRE